MGVEVRGQSVGTGSHLLPCGSQGLRHSLTNPIDYRVNCTKQTNLGRFFILTMEACDFFQVGTQPRLRGHYLDAMHRQQVAAGSNKLISEGR